MKPLLLYNIYTQTEYRHIANLPGSLCEGVLPGRLLKFPSTVFHHWSSQSLSLQTVIGKPGHTQQTIIHSLNFYSVNFVVTSFGRQNLFLQNISKGEHLQFFLVSISFLHVFWAFCTAIEAFSTSLKCPSTQQKYTTTLTDSTKLLYNTS